MLKKLKEMLKSLASMEGALDDAFYALPEYNANTDSRGYIDSARNELYVLKNKDTSHQNKQYKQNKKELRMKHNDFLLNFNSSHANDYDIFDEVA